MPLYRAGRRWSPLLPLRGSKGKTVKGKRRSYYRVSKKGGSQVEQALSALDQFLTQPGFPLTAVLVPGRPFPRTPCSGGRSYVRVRHIAAASNRLGQTLQRLGNRRGTPPAHGPVALSPR